MRRARRTLPAAAVAAILAAFLVFFAAASAGATGGISGRVTGPDGEPLAGVTVYAHMITPNPLPWNMFGDAPKKRGVVAWAQTGEDGAYAFTGLEPTPQAWCNESAHYCLSFWPPTGSDFTPKVICSRRGPPRLPLTVDDGTSLTGIDLLLAPPTSISGTVTGTDGMPVVGALVGADSIMYGYDACNTARCTTTDGLGRYVLTDLSNYTFKVNDDQYYLKVTPPGAPSWNLYYPGSADPMPFRPAPGQRTEGMDVVVPTPGRIVIEPEPGGIKSAWAFTSGFDERYWYYDLTLPPGTYRVGFYSPSAGHTYYPGSFQWEEAAPVEVRAGETTSISLTPAPSGTVQGRVVDGSGQPVAGVAVGVEKVLPCDPPVLTETDGEGRFSISSSGDRKLHFSKHGFLGGWFDGKTDAGTADLVHFRSGETTTLPDVVLISRGDPGSISGTVTAAGAPTASARVEIWTSPLGTSPLRTIVPAVGGRYEATDLAPDSYLVRFFDSAAGTPYGEKWYPDSVSAPMAAPVVVEAGLQTGGVDADLGAMGNIAGTLTVNHGPPFYGGSERVCLTDASGNLVRCTPLVGPSGVYSFSGVAPGSYLVAFDTSNSYTKARWYPDQDSAATATPIVVAPGAAVTGIDWDFLPYGSLQGVIQATHGDVGGYMAVVDADSGTVWYRDDWYLPLGPFSLGLYPGRYRLLFASTELKYIPQWYPGTPFASGAQVIEVLPGQTTSGINVLLENYGYNRPPVLTQPDDIGTTEGAEFALTLAATDADGDLLTFGAENLPTGAMFDPYAGKFHWTPTCTQAGVYPAVRFTVTDHGRPALSAEVTVPVSVAARDCAPVLAPIGNKSVIAGELLTFPVAATNPEGGSVTLEITDIPAGATFDGANGNFAWRPGSAQAGSIQVTFAAVSTLNGSLRDEETVTITALGPLLFRDEFSHDDLPADPDWLTLSGTWAVRDQAFRAYPQTTAVAVPGPGNPAGSNFAAGRIASRVLLGSRLLTTPNLALVFGYRDAQHYRYVRFFPGETEIGQVGVIDGQPATRQRFPRGIDAGRWQGVRVDIHPGGTVRAFVGQLPVGALKFPAAVLGNVGVMSRNARAFVDDFRLWSRAVLD